MISLCIYMQILSNLIAQITQITALSEERMLGLHPTSLILTAFVDIDPII